MEIINLDNKTIKYTVIKSQRKTCAIQIDNSGNVIVKVPNYYTQRYIIDFLQQNKIWLVSKMEKVEAIKKRYSEHEYIQGEKFLYLGMELPLVIEQIDGNGMKLVLKENCFYASMGKVMNSGNQKYYLQQGLKLLYKKMARRILIQKTKYFADLIKVSFNKIFIKEQKTRWGSCSALNNINYNWKIIMAPEEIVDYLVVHELCHIRFRNHAKEYWNEVAKYIPDYKSRRDWLKENGSTLDLEKEIRRK